MTTTTASALESLPSTLLELICEYIGCRDCKKLSLHGFSLTSKHCCCAATAQRFSRVQVTVRGQKKLRDDLRRWSKMLGANDRFRHVRQLKITGFVPREKAEDAKVDLDTHMVEAEDGLSSDNDFCKPPKQPVHFWHGATRLSQEDNRQLDKAWQPLSCFIRKLSGLKDVVYAADGQIPRCILEAVHFMNCRLHMHTFSLRSLFQPRDLPQVIDADEYALATSPCLYSIIVPYYTWDEEGNVNYNEEAVLHGGRGSAEIGSCLSVAVSAEYHTDFSRLQHLAIRWWDENRDASASIQDLAEKVRNNKFESLHTLVSSLPNNDAHHEGLTLLLRHLRPLKSLELVGFASDKAFEALLHQHGKTLRKLKLMPDRQLGQRTPMLVLSHDRMQELSERCSNLEHIELPVIRTEGDKREAGIYRALAQLPRLKHATLQFQYSAGPTEEEMVDEDGEVLCQNMGYDEDIPPDRLREAYINAAIDYSLALSIFCAISSAMEDSGS
ncbi:uncharacterized protein BCR38DRAFT_405975 [Pseudomassariella vexata]|uniref:Uncharacterized protein n=1 Tax=Pseudomassariella vexata TaxID=1141098 RepID=A0A1Y2EFK5_9PEZI|nr:uncharacterized protein BCR38DRAFT_405975 [Pseudomassariella vexata]ORY70360.1 hypothetical protein BCR38DRAFT_405975 [Pseudomassariella vexata]